MRPAASRIGASPKTHVPQRSVSGPSTKVAPYVLPSISNVETMALLTTGDPAGVVRVPTTDGPVSPQVKVRSAAIYSIPPLTVAAEMAERAPAALTAERGPASESAERTVFTSSSIVFCDRWITLSSPYSLELNRRPIWIFQEPPYWPL